MKTEIWLSREAWGHEPGSPTVLVLSRSSSLPNRNQSKGLGDWARGSHLLLPSQIKAATFRYTVTELPFFWNGSCLSIYHSFWDCPLIKSLQSTAILNHTHTKTHRQTDTHRQIDTHRQGRTCTHTHTESGGEPYSSPGSQIKLTVWLVPSIFTAIHHLLSKNIPQFLSVGFISLSA